MYMRDLGEALVQVEPGCYTFYCPRPQEVDFIRARYGHAAVKPLFPPPPTRFPQWP